mmetsp:Transcript_81533/g.251677  ORF Transcript_81533/g.251677 Transcript_81533/m.251677 type:complete len:212 (+) Transcript_81533:348-983(+)
MASGAKPVLRQPKPAPHQPRLQHLPWLLAASLAPRGGPQALGWRLSAASSVGSSAARTRLPSHRPRPPSSERQHHRSDPKQPAPAAAAAASAPGKRLRASGSPGWAREAPACPRRHRQRLQSPRLRPPLPSAHQSLRCPRSLCSPTPPFPQRPLPPPQCCCSRAALCRLHLRGSCGPPRPSSSAPRCPRPRRPPRRTPPRHRARTREPSLW